MTFNPESKYPSRRTDVLKVRSDANPDALVESIASDLQANASVRSMRCAFRTLVQFSFDVYRETRSIA